METTTERMAGCQSLNHDQCYGELWQCAVCGKTVCCAEGTDDHRELCDDCWASRFHTGSADGGDMKQAELVDQLVHDLIEHYEAEVLPSGLIYLELTMDGYGVLVVEEKIKRRQMCVCYWLYDAQGHPVPEPQILFYLGEDAHWIPYEFTRHTAGHKAFALFDKERSELLVTDEANQEALAHYTDLWAEVLRTQGWIGGADKIITQPQEWLEEENAPDMPPSVEDLWDWMDEYGKCTATDGCWVEPDGHCEHGHPSWLLELGLI